MSKLGSLYIKLGEPDGPLDGCTCEVGDWAADEIERLRAKLAAAEAKALPEDVRSFIYTVTLFLQASRSKKPEQMDMMFQRAYCLYEKYDVEGRRAQEALKEADDATDK